MKRLALVAVAASMLAMPVMQAEAAPLAQPTMPQSHLAQVDWKKSDHRDYRSDRRVVVKKKVVTRSHWQRGQKYRDWRRYKAVRDYNRYGLRRPGPGQHWIRVGNDYLLVSALTGIIAGITAAH
ncbi:RcnB family protein [Mesorhizobium sp. SP-1A]|uniref:RcnB family protein n=1 Tax=Mesorhizobium sp. SP-1A TaxID=3077840 RepID=UPI0028F6E516|nr:RcnB family protein [Mesorhizobium sp. SP-1A]